MREDIKAYIDGELAPERMEEVRKAIESDPALMQEYTEMKNISGMLQSLARQPQVKGVERTKGAIAPQRRFRWKEGIAVAATLIVIAVFAAPIAMRAGSGEADGVALNFDTGDANGLERELKREEAMADDEAFAYKSKARSEGGAGAASAEMPATGVAQDAFGNPGGLARQSPVAPAESTPSLADLDVRLVVKDASFTVKVQDIQASMDKATQLAKSLNGYIESSTMTEPEGRNMERRGYLTLRVPQGKFEKAVEQIRGYGEVKSESTSGDDVTGQVTDIEARMNTLKAEEESLRTILRKTTRIGEILEVKDRISQVRQQIESYDSQRRTLRSLASLSTISLTFTSDKKMTSPVPDDGDEAWFQDTKEAALGVLTGIGRFVAQVATFAFILLPVWLPLLLFLLWFRKRAFSQAVTGG